MKYSYELVYLKDGAAKTELLTAAQAKTAGQHWQKLVKSGLPARIVGLGKDGKAHAIVSGPDVNWEEETQRCVELSYGTAQVYTFFCDKYPQEDTLTVRGYNGRLVDVKIVGRCIKTVDEIREILFSGVDRIKRIEEVIVK